MINVALKEWKIVIDLMLEGRLTFLLRKGGIHERSGPGTFELDHPRFALFPAFEHQKPAMIKPICRDRVEMLAQPATVLFEGYAEATDIREVPSREAFDALDDLHPWTAEQIDMRFDYRPENPLYLVVVRAYRLAEPKPIDYRESFSGCRSWVPLDPGEEVDEAGAKPAVSDAEYAALLSRINRALGLATEPQSVQDGSRGPRA